MPIALSQIRNLPPAGPVGRHRQVRSAPSRSQAALQRAQVEYGLGTVNQHALHRAGFHQTGRRSSTADNASGQRYTYNQTHNELAVLFAITRKAIDDNSTGPSSVLRLWV